MNQKYRKTRPIILYGIYILVSLLFLADNFTDLDIKNQMIKAVAYIGFGILTPIILIWNFFDFKTVASRILISILLALFLFIIINGFTHFIFATSTWKTQTILYEHPHFSNKAVEFQMRDVGGLGYRKRIVEVLYLTNWFMIANEVKSETEFEGKIEWKKVNKDVNELELKYP